MSIFLLFLSVARRSGLLLPGLLACPIAVLAQVPPPPSGPYSDAAPPARHMSAELRESIDKVVVMAGNRAAADPAVAGTYGKSTRGLIGGMDAGARIGRIEKEVGPVPVVIPIPVLQIPGMIFGGLTGAAQREIQEFRDALTEELVEADSQTLTDDGLALDVFWGIRRLPAIDSKLFAPSVPIPADTDAVLFIRLTGLEIDVDGRDAIITASAGASLHRTGQAFPVFETERRYRDRAALKEWTADDNRLWRDFINYARHYLGRELAAAVFDRVELGERLEPAETDSAKRDRRNDRLFVSESPSPTLAWNFELADGEERPALAADLSIDDLRYDVEIYDAHQLVYAEEQVPGPAHTLAMPLECGSYRWSVRPAYRLGEELRFGDWMRFEPPPDPDEEDKNENDHKPKRPEPFGLVGRDASAAPAYTQDFPRLEIDCG